MSKARNLADLLDSNGDVSSANLDNVTPPDWGNIGGTLTDQTDLSTALGTKANTADLGTAAATDSTAYATAAQGALADSAVQPSDNVSTLTNDAGYATTSYVDTAESDANAYTDTRETAITTAYQTYANQAEADAISTAAADATSKANAALASANSYTDTAVAGLVDTAPATLDTLNELAAALGDDPNFATTVSTQIGSKLDASHDMTLTLAGDATGSATFTNMGNATLTVAVADDSHNHIIANVDGLQAALDGKVDDSQVLTNVPAGAVFTDTTYSVGNGGLTEINFTSALNTKLAGIEAGATGDQSAAEILTAIKTVDGAGSGLDADTLDGIQASSFLQGNQTITLSGDASGSGTTSIAVTVNNDSHSHSTSTITGLGSLATLSAVGAAQITDNSVGAAELNVSGNGTAGQVLASDGDGTMTWVTPEGGGGSSTAYYTTSGTWTKPSGINKVEVEIMGGGGGGSAVQSNNTAGGQYGSGGGAGGYGYAIYDVTNINSVAITVGAGGAGGSGVTGGASSFGTYITANGGEGGGTQNDTGRAACANGNIVGGTSFTVPAKNNATSAEGAASLLGKGGNNNGTANTVGNGNAAEIYGSGGGPGWIPGATNGQMVGGAGSAGFVIVRGISS